MQAHSGACPWSDGAQRCGRIWALGGTQAGLILVQVRSHNASGTLHVTTRHARVFVHRVAACVPYAPRSMRAAHRVAARVQVTFASFVTCLKKHFATGGPRVRRAAIVLYTAQLVVELTMIATTVIYTRNVRHRLCALRVCNGVAVWGRAAKASACRSTPRARRAARRASRTCC